MTATAQATPTWLLEPEVGLCPCGCIGRRRKGSYVSKTVNGGAERHDAGHVRRGHRGAAGLAATARPTGEGRHAARPARRRVARAQSPVLVAAYAATLLLAALSKLSLGFFVKRVWLFVPIFTGIVVLPATLNLITPGAIVVPLGTWFGHEVGLTRQGLTRAALIVTRVATSISLVVLLTLTTLVDRAARRVAVRCSCRACSSSSSAWPIAICSIS